jgi:hypothetical protein
VNVQRIYFNLQFDFYDMIIDLLRKVLPYRLFISCIFYLVLSGSEICSNINIFLLIIMHIQKTDSVSGFIFRRLDVVPFSN